MTTIYDIAKATSVSPATVSRVINGRPGVNAKTESKIRNAMEKLDFQPRWKAFDRKRLLLLIPSHHQALCDTYVSHVVAGVADASFAIGYTLVVRPFLPNARSGREIRQLVMQEGVSGCLMISLPRGYNLADRIGIEKIPHVIIGYKAHDNHANQVLPNDYQSGWDATQYLISLNHRRIAMISFSHEDHGHAQRAQGYIDALHQAYPKQKPLCLQFNDATQAAGAEGARQLLSSPERPTAIIITNEMLTLGAQREIKEMGFNIPRDISLIGFEETNSLENLDTPLTALKTPAYEMGAGAVEMLLQETDGETPGLTDNKVRHLPLPLIARRSTLSLQA